MATFLGLDWNSEVSAVHEWVSDPIRAGTITQVAGVAVLLATLRAFASFWDLHGMHRWSMSDRHLIGAFAVARRHRCATTILSGALVLAETLGSPANWPGAVLGYGLGTCLLSILMLFVGIVADRVDDEPETKRDHVLESLGDFLLFAISMALSALFLPIRIFFLLTDANPVVQKDQGPSSSTPTETQQT